MNTLRIFVLSIQGRREPRRVSRLLTLFLLLRVSRAANALFVASHQPDGATLQELHKWPIMSRAAFTAAECNNITELYKSKLTSSVDRREAESVSRINRFDNHKVLLHNGDLDWILERIANNLPLDGYAGQLPSMGSRAILHDSIDFTLLHEFNEGMHFGLHVDTKPHDGTGRTYNVNIMLSDASEYSGGELQVGDSVVENLQKGDLYFYPASLPHAVHPLEAGLRYTFVLALRLPANGKKGSHEQSQISLDQQQSSYWEDAEQRLNALSGKMGELESRLHLIHAQFLEASGDRTTNDIDAAYCKAYRSTPEAALYAQRFFEDGQSILQQSTGTNALLAASNYFGMVVCIDPTHKEAAEALKATSSLLSQSEL